MQPELIIFDMDGLMFDTERAWIEYISRFLDGRGIAFDVDALYDTIGTPNLNIGKMFLNRELRDPGPKELMREGMDAFMEDLVTRGVPKKPGLDDLLAEIGRRGIPAAVATSTPRSRAERLLEAAGVRGRFAYLVTGEEVARSKPFPDVFLRACELAGTSPSDTLVLEDSLAGVKAAAASGAACIMVPDLLEPDEETVLLALAVTGSLADVPGILGWTPEKPL